MTPTAADGRPTAAGCVLYRRGQALGGPALTYLLARTRHNEWAPPKVRLRVDEAADVGARRSALRALGVECELDLAAGAHELVYALPVSVSEHAGAPALAHALFFCAPVPLGVRTPEGAVWLPLAAAELRAGHPELRELLRRVDHAVRKTDGPAPGPTVAPDPAPVDLSAALSHDALHAILALADAETLGAAWSVSRAWHEVAAALTARALTQLDGLIAAAEASAASPASHAPPSLSVDDTCWLAQLPLPLLTAKLGRSRAALGALAAICYDAAISAPEHPSQAPRLPPRARAHGASPTILPRLPWSAAPRLARACATFASVDQCCDVPPAAALPASRGPFCDVLLARLREASRAEGGYIRRWASLDDGRAVPDEPAAAARLPACRLAAQLFAAGFAPWADRRRTLRIYSKLVGRLLYDVDLYVDRWREMSAARRASAADAAVAASAAVAQRVASDSVLALSELVANCGMRLELEIGNTSCLPTRQAFHGLLDSVVVTVAELLPELLERWVAHAPGALTPPAVSALRTLAAFADAGWSLPPGHPGIPELGVPSERLPRLVFASSAGALSREDSEDIAVVGALPGGGAGAAGPPADPGPEPAPVEVEAQGGDDAQGPDEAGPGGGGVAAADGVGAEDDAPAAADV